MAVLRSAEGGQSRQIIPLEASSAVLGRHPDCDIVLESGAVSREHARISRLGNDYYIEDLHSRNGTFVNGQAVLDQTRLNENDRLAICDLTFTFHETPCSAESPLSAGGSQAAAMMVDDARPASNSTVMSKVNISSGATGLQLEVNAATKLKALVEIGKNLRSALGLDGVLPGLLDSLFAIFLQADRGFVVLKGSEKGNLIPMAVKYRRNEEKQTIRISRTIVNGVMESREAILSADAASDSRFDMAESIVDFHIRSMMCAPLIDSGGDALGVIQIDTLDQRNRFKREDLDVLASVACQAAFAVENAQLHEMALRERALAHELDIAHEVQRGFLPAESPEFEGYEFFGHYVPANQLGGDYYDYIPLPDGRLAVVIADVSGKGIAAALLMAKLSAEAGYCLASEPTPGEAVGRLNRIFCGSAWEDRFVTFVVAVIDPTRHEVTFVNAGHLPPLLRHAGSEVEPLTKAETELPLGVKEDVVYPHCTMRLEPGDCVAMYTDGITEAMNKTDELYGNERLGIQLGQTADKAGSIGREILADVKRFVGKRAQADDTCVVCFGRVVDE